MDKLKYSFFIGFIAVIFWAYFDSSINQPGILKFFADLILLFGLIMISGGLNKERIMKVMFNQ